MAQRVLDFHNSINVDKVDLLGFSMGGYIAQMATLNGKGIVRRLVIASSGLSYGENAPDHTAERQKELGQIAGNPEPTYGNCFSQLFFYPSETSQAAGHAWWDRVHQRSESASGESRSEVVSYKYDDGGAGVKAMVAAGQTFKNPEKGANRSYDRFEEIEIPVFVANGKDDFMIPTRHTFVMQQKLPNATARTFPDIGHGFLYQLAEEFAGDVTKVLAE